MKPNTRGMRRAAVAISAALALGLAACGDDDSSDSTTVAEEPSAATVDVTAVEYEFDLSATPTTDTETVTFTNDGKEAHALIFARLGEGYTVDEAFELEGKKGSPRRSGRSTLRRVRPQR